MRAMSYARPLLEPSPKSYSPASITSSIGGSSVTAHRPDLAAQGEQQGLPTVAPPISDSSRKNPWETSFTKSTGIVSESSTVDYGPAFQGWRGELSDPAQTSNVKSQLRPSRSTQERGPLSDYGERHSRSADEQRLSFLTRGFDSEQQAEPSIELSGAAVRPESSLRQDSVSLEPPTSVGSHVGALSHRSSEHRSGSLLGSGRRDSDRRVIFINSPEQTNDRFDYAGNGVQTSKYTAFTFLPKNLFEQFHRIAYVYFLVLICLNQIPQLAVFGKIVSLVPLLFVLVVTALKDGYEDWRRHRSDRRENNRLAKVFKDGEYKSKPWKHIMVGELVKVEANDTIPCDLVLLRTSDPNGVAYVETINLDGESNLKTRYARLETAARLEVAEKVGDPHPITGKIVCEKPNRNIYGFTAFAEIDGKMLSLGPSNVILRGCDLRNTSWVVGIAVYAGQETKAMLNSVGAQSKRSRLERNMNRETLWLSVFLFLTCFTGGLGMGLWLERHEEQLDYSPYYRKQTLTLVREDYNYYGRVGEAILTFLSDVISFQVMIPISLYISMELVRVGQSYFMIQDAEMYHSASNTRLQCRALNINEDLGQIRHVFSDKTGTVTENKMEFKNASIFGENFCDPEVSVSPTGNVEGPLGPEDEHVMKEVLGKSPWKPKVGVKVDLRLVRMLQGWDDSVERKAVHDYLLTLAACNTVVPTKVRMTNSGQVEMEVALAAEEGTCLVEYQGESPDEQALVSAAASYGYILLERTSSHVVINVLGIIQRFEVLGMHEFDSVRKCMSVVVQCPDGVVKVLVKGADSSMLQKIALTAETTPLEDSRLAQIIFDTKMHLDLYAKEGLRTLVIAAKDLSAEDLKLWQKLYTRAGASLTDRLEKLLEAAKLVEKDLLLLGASGIEDKLQEGVPETIAALREAGIKVWLLTGDKQETAISIGFSCALLTNDMQQIIINESEKGSCGEALRNAKATYVHPAKKSFSVMTGGGQDHTSSTIDFFSTSMPQQSPTLSQLLHADSLSAGSKSMDSQLIGSQASHVSALIIDGNSLVHALNKDLEEELFELAAACKVVICCRVAPLQKAAIVSLVKQKSGEMTLAIGDGANDVSMIQKADVGVGISGQEGRQAVLASDFAMGQFRFLRRLLFVHGSLNYSRLGYMVLYNFYRNAVFVLLLFWYIIYTAFSTSSAITEWSRVLYSVIYTSVPTIVVAIMDKGVSHSTLMECPGLYKGGQNNQSYNRILFWVTMLDTLWQSLVLFFVPVLTYWHSTTDIWSLGSVWIISLVILVSLHLAMDIEYWTWITHLAVWGSIAATYICIIVLDILTDNTSLANYWVIFNVARTACYWLNILLITCLGLLPRFLVKVLKKIFWPSDVQIAREEESLKNSRFTGARS